MNNLGVAHCCIQINLFSSIYKVKKVTLPLEQSHRWIHYPRNSDVYYPSTRTKTWIGYISELSDEIKPAERMSLQKEQNLCHVLPSFPSATNSIARPSCCLWRKVLFLDSIFSGVKASDLDLYLKQALKIHALQNKKTADACAVSINSEVWWFSFAIFFALHNSSHPVVDDAICATHNQEKRQLRMKSWNCLLERAAPKVLTMRNRITFSTIV